MFLSRHKSISAYVSRRLWSKINRAFKPQPVYVLNGFAPCSQWSSFMPCDWDIWGNAFRKFFLDDFNAFDNYLPGLVMLTDLLPLFDVLWIMHVDGSVQDCHNSSALAMELLQCCVSHWCYIFHFLPVHKCIDLYYIHWPWEISISFIDSSIYSLQIWTECAFTVIRWSH